MKRRDFITNTSKLGACALLGVSVLSQSGCASYPMLHVKALDKSLSIPLAEFQKTKRILVRTTSLEFDIFVHEFEAGKYRATLLQCTHHQEPIKVSDQQIYCPSHGSTFSLDGQVVKAPAKKELKHYPTRISEDGKTLLIQMES
jgi:cytochrome b6-f complex iron-sulfur subunit